jgi:hemoglobin/transferrin/lactoferrin receptor protein
MTHFIKKNKFHSALLLTFFAVSVHAQEMLHLDAVTVTAKGFESAVSDTARSINLIESDHIRRTEARALGDLLRGEPGIALAVDGSVGLDPIIRGLKRDQVLILVDGVRINAMQPPARGSLASYVNVDMIERIEVIRGPNSVLYGAGAMGGVINIITRSGDFSDTPTMSGWTRVGFTSVDDGARLAGGISLSNARNVLDISIAGLKTNDYQMGDGTRLQDSGTEQFAGYLRYRTVLAEGHEAQLRVQRDRREDVWYLASRRFLPDNIMMGPFSQPAGVNTHYAPHKTRTVFEASYDGQLHGAWDPKVSASIYRQELSRGNYDWNDRLQKNYRTSDSDFDTNGLRAQIALVPAPRHLLLVGVEAWQLKASPLSFLADANFDATVRTPLIIGGQIESQGIFIQDEIDLGDFLLSLGGRYDRVKGSADSIFVSPGNYRMTDLDRSDHTFSWAAGLNWSFHPALSPYISVSEGYRAASLLERYLTYPYSDGFNWVSNPQLQPERNRTLELGARGVLGNTQYAAAVFESQIRDYIGGSVFAPGFKNTVNLDNVRIRGLEVTIDHSLTSDINAFFVGTILRGDNQDPAFREPLVQMPPSEFSVGLEQRSTVGLQWQGKIRVVEKQSRTADQFTAGTERATSGFATADLAVGYRFPASSRLRENELTFSVNNAFDRDYREHVSGIVARNIDPANGVQDIKAPGRSIGLTWATRF